MPSEAGDKQYESDGEWVEVLAAEQAEILHRDAIKSPNGIKRFDHDRIEKAVREILLAIGENPAREGLADTPRRVANMYQEIFAGLTYDPAEHLQTVFTSEESSGIVLLKDIEFFSTCEHHLLPIFGRAHVAYVPDGKLVGLSKLARVVEGFARRPQIQERMTNQVADAVYGTLGAEAVAVLIEAKHMCMTIRGIQKHDSWMITSAYRGRFETDESLRDEFLKQIARGISE